MAQQDLPGFTLLVGSSSHGGLCGRMAVRIYAALDRELTGEDHGAARCAHDELCKALELQSVKLDPATQKLRQQTRDDLVALFGNRSIFVEEIPNLYLGADSPMALRSPWLLVTTAVGHIRVGWRKSVIEIDWSRTVNRRRSDELFADESVTKDDYLIHAHSLADARVYIRTILG